MSLSNKIKMVVPFDFFSIYDYNAHVLIGYGYLMQTFKNKLKNTIEIKKHDNGDLKSVYKCWLSARKCGTQGAYFLVKHK